jgi:isoleucyl-tRNA synthetase
VDEAGRFTSEVPHFAGRSVLDVNDDIIAWLRAQGILLHAWNFTHSYPHCWRCRRPVIFRATDQWFMIVDHDGHRDRCLDRVENAVKWDPPNSKNRIREAVRNRPDWCLSRQRSWGVGIPGLYCEACGAATLDRRVLERAAQRTRESDSDSWYERSVEEFLPDGFTCPSCGKPGPFRKEEDVLDVWFDSGSTHRAIQGFAPGAQAGVGTGAQGQGRRCSTSRAPISTAAGSTPRSWSASASSARRRSRSSPRTAGCWTRPDAPCTNRSATS